jgi:hypothetical protein
MKKIPFWDATLEIPRLIWNRRFITVFARTLHCVHIVPVHIAITYFSNIYFSIVTDYLEQNRSWELIAAELIKTIPALMVFEF